MLFTLVFICLTVLLSSLQIKTMLPGEHQQVLSNLQSHFDEFLEDSEESKVFTMADCAQLERDVAACKEYYQELLRSAERGKAQISLPLLRNNKQLVYIVQNTAKGNTWLLRLLSLKLIPIGITLILL